MLNIDMEEYKTLIAYNFTRNRSRQALRLWMTISAAVLANHYEAKANKWKAKALAMKEKYNLENTALNFRDELNENL